MLTVSFDAVGERDAEILILGTLPGPKSLARGRYYEDGHNSFWKVIAGIYGEIVPLMYDAGIAMLRRHKIAVWDVLKSGERIAAADRTIENPVANDIIGFVAAHPSLRIIAFNGTEARTQFDNLVGAASLPSGIRLITLPSTSGSNRSPLTEKITSWQQLLL